ncbi:MAG: MATE family efflux transporter [Bacillota bacterium]|nr:MATE family efflux transporter [Bacillota bacterium]
MTAGKNLNETIKNTELLRMLGKVALPIALQSLIGSSLSLIDNLMVGSLGEVELNAVGVSVQIFFIYWMLLYGFAGGAATFISQFFGVRDLKNIRRTTGFAITVAFGIGLLFFTVTMIFPQYILRIFTRFPEVIQVGVDYVRIGAPTFLMLAITQPLTIALRATQQTRIPLYASASALAINTFLNYLLIFGKWGFPELGVAGAALATCIARFLEMSFLLIAIFGRKNLISGRLSEFFSYNKDLAVRIVKNALPTTINETLWGIGTSMYIAAFARIGITAGAAIQACNTINNMFSMAAFSIGDAVLILVGQKLGEGNKSLAYDMSKKMTKIGVVVGAILGIGIIIMGEPILSLFSFSAEGADYAGKILIVYGATLWLSLYNGIHITGTLRCGGDTRYAMFTETATVWLIGVPLAFLTSLWLQWPIYFAVLAVKSEEAVKAVFLTRRYLSKKWLNNVIHGIDD